MLLFGSVSWKNAFSFYSRERGGDLQTRFPLQTISEQAGYVACEENKHPRVLYMVGPPTLLAGSQQGDQVLLCNPG